MNYKAALFNLSLFNPNFAVFPQQVFKEPFDEYLFMNLEDWFNNESDYNFLCFFLQANNEPYLHCAVPNLYHCPDLKIDITAPHAAFINEYLLKSTEGELGIGLRISPIGFWYGQSLDWAIVSDLTNNIYIVGLKHQAALNFKANFAGRFFDIHHLLAKMKETNFLLGKRNNPDFKYTEMENKDEIINRYNGNAVFKSYQLQFFTEYYQFYIKDKHTKASTDSDSFWTAQASEDKMAIEDGLLGISVAKYAKIRVQVNMHTQTPVFDLDENYDHIVEAAINISSGIIQIADCTANEIQLELNVASGIYTVRSSSANLETVKGDEGDDYYVVDIYPSGKKERTVLKRYQQTS
jgi:hypothetical protein